MNKKIAVISLLMFLFISSSIFAETIVLKSGKTIEGKILEKTDKYIKIDTEGIPITYYLEDIANIDGKTIYITKRPSLKQVSSVSTSNSAEEYFKNGLAQCEQGNFSQAISGFSKAIEINPNLAVAYFFRGFAYDHISKQDQAIADYSKAIEIDPNYTDAYYNRGVDYGCNKGTYDQATADFSKVIELSPNDPSTYVDYNNRGVVYYKKGDYDQAILDYNKAIELNSKDADVYKDRAEAYYAKQEYNKAWNDVHKAEELGAKIASMFMEKLKKASGRDK